MKYKCCNLLTGGIEFRYNGISLCQRVDHVGGGDIVVQTYDENNPKSFKFDINNYFKRKKEIIEQNKTGKIYHKCEGCVELIDREWPEVENQKIFQMILHHWTKCNSHCIYCYTNKDKEYFNKRNSYKFLPILKELDKKNLLDYGGICSYAGGEVSCLKEFESIVKILDKYDCFPIFNSSCIKYEKTIAKHLKKGNGMLIVSVDCGNRELHKKIKQVDSFEKVWKNIKKYASECRKEALLYAKYIVLKDINDNEKSIDEFLLMSKKNGVKYVLMEIDHYYFIENRENIPEYIVNLYYYAYKRAKELGLICQIYSNSSVLLLQGKWADEFWRDKCYDAGIEIDKYAYRSLYSYNKKDGLSRYANIKGAEGQTKVSYADIFKACEMTAKNKSYKINNTWWFYAEDIEFKDEQGNIKVNMEKIQKIVNKNHVLNFKKETK